MSAMNDFDRTVAAWLQADGPADINGIVFEQAITSAGAVRQRRGLRLALFGPAPWPAYGKRIGFATLPAAVRIAILVALSVAALAGAAYVGIGARLFSDVTSFHGYRGVLVGAPDLLVPRWHPIAVTLADGRVLIVGGNTNGSGVEPTTAEVFDPATGDQRLTGDLVEAARLHVDSVALLADGRVLLVGQRGGPDPGAGHYSAVVQLFDPATSTFVPGPPMLTPRIWGQLARLPDGRVLMAGGMLATGPVVTTASAELFDPVAGTFTATGSLLTDRFAQSLALLADGRVLVAGGDSVLADGEGKVAMSIEVYDPARGSFQSAGMMDTVQFPFLIPRADGRALIFSQSMSRTAGMWHGGVVETVPWRAEPFVPATATPMVDGRIFFTGQWPNSTRAWTYDPVGGTFADVSGLIGHNVYAAVRLLDGRILAIGGYANDDFDNQHSHIGPAISTMQIFE